MDFSTTQTRCQTALNTALSQPSPSAAASALVSALTAHELTPGESLRVTLLLSFHLKLHELMQAAQRQSLALSDASSGVSFLVDLSALVASRGDGWLAAAAPFLLLEYACDGDTIQGCIGLFDMITVSERLERLTSETIFRPLSRLTLLRLCNNLLKRLSSNSHREFRGRVLMLLADILPLDERSGVNVGSKFHETNVTSFVPAPLPPAVAAKTDARLYEAIWSLQAVFSKPMVLASAETWAKFADNLGKTLDALKNTPVSTLGKDEDKPSVQFSTADAPKYLTGPELLHLQIRDAQFRRHVLVQCLVLFDYLLHTEKPSADAIAHNSVAALAAAAASSSSAPSASAPRYKNTVASSSAQIVQVATFRRQVIALLSQLPHGKALVRDVQHILTRERNYIAWKNAAPKACPPIQKPSIDAEQLVKTPLKLAKPAPKKRKASAGSRRPFGMMGMGMMAGMGAGADDDDSGDGYEHFKGTHNMGSKALAGLWNVREDVFEDDMRVFAPQLEELYDYLEQDEHPDNTDEDLKYKNSKKFVWRCLRRMSEEDYSKFVASKGSLHPVAEEYKKVWAKKNAPEGGGEEEEVQDGEDGVKEEEEEEEEEQVEVQQGTKRKLEETAAADGDDGGDDDDDQDQDMQDAEQGEDGEEEESGEADTEAAEQPSRKRRRVEPKTEESDTPQES